jgi:hypothetical protein
MGFCFGDVLEAIEPALDSARPALIHCYDDGTDRVMTFGQTRVRSNNLARALLAGGGGLRR